MEINVPSSAHYHGKDDFSIDTTDFETFNLPAPKFWGGTNNDVVLEFENREQINDYCEKINQCKIVKPLTPSDFLKNKKIERINKSLSLYIECEETIEYFANKAFREVQSGMPYVFRHGNTLQFGSFPNQVAYSIFLKDDLILLDAGLDSELLEIVQLTNGTIELRSEFSKNVKLVLIEDKA